MSDCQHNDLKRTEGAFSVTDDGSPIYYCAAKCGSGLFVVTPLRIEVGYGRPEVPQGKLKEEST